MKEDNNHSGNQKIKRLFEMIMAVIKSSCNNIGKTSMENEENNKIINHNEVP